MLVTVLVLVLVTLLVPAVVPLKLLLLDGAMALKPIGSNNIVIIVGLRKDRKLSRDLIDFVR